MAMDTIKNLMQQFGSNLENKLTEPELAFPSLPTLNEYLFGFQRSKLITIGARPSQGKSSFAAQIALDISMQHNVLFFSLESEVREFIERIFLHMAKIDNQYFRKAEGSQFKDQVEHVIKVLEGSNMILVDAEKSYARQFKYIEEITRDVTKEVPVDAVFIDYIQCISEPKKTELEAIKEMVHGFRRLAIEKNFAAVMCSQINRSGVGAPSMSSYKGSGVIEEHSDVCISLDYPYQLDKEADVNDFVIRIDKNKSGMTGVINGVKFYPEHYLFHDGNHGGLQYNWEQAAKTANRNRKAMEG